MSSAFLNMRSIRPIPVLDSAIAKFSAGISLRDFNAFCFDLGANMSAQKFSELYNSHRNRLFDSYLNKRSKSELIDLIKPTSELIKTAELTIFTQSDALFKSSNELMKQCELNRNASEAASQMSVLQTYASKISVSNIRPAFNTLVANEKHR